MMSTLPDFLLLRSRELVDLLREEAAGAFSIRFLLQLSESCGRLLRRKLGVVRLRLALLLVEEVFPRAAAGELFLNFRPVAWAGWRVHHWRGSARGSARARAKGVYACAGGACA